MKMKISNAFSIPGFLVMGLIVFELTILFLIIYIWIAVESQPTSQEAMMSINVVSILGKVALTIILSWLGILMAYYGWIIYFYNYNYGRHSSFGRIFLNRLWHFPPMGLRMKMIFMKN